MCPNKILVESVWLIRKLPCVTLKSVLGQQLRDRLFPFEALLGFLTLTCLRVVHLNSDLLWDGGPGWTLTQWKHHVKVCVWRFATCCRLLTSSYLGWHQLQPLGCIHHHTVLIIKERLVALMTSAPIKQRLTLIYTAVIKDESPSPAAVWFHRSLLIFVVVSDDSWSFYFSFSLSESTLLLMFPLRGGWWW